MADPKTQNVVFLYVTVPDKKTCDAISIALLEDGIAACTNAIPGMESRYRWKGEIQTSREFVMIVKTISEMTERCRGRIAALHPYEVPCILTLPITDGNFEYLAWLKGAIG